MRKWEKKSCWYFWSAHFYWQTSRISIICDGRGDSSRKSGAREDVLVDYDLDAFPNESFIHDGNCKRKPGAGKGFRVERDVIVIPAPANEKEKNRQAKRDDVERCGGSYSSSWSMNERRGVFVMPASVHLFGLKSVERIS